MNQDSFNELWIQYQENILATSDVANIVKEKMKFCSLELNYLIDTGLRVRLSQLKTVFPNNWEHLRQLLIPEKIYRNHYVNILKRHGIIDCENIPTHFLQSICVNLELTPVCSGFTINEFLTVG